MSTPLGDEPAFPINGACADNQFNGMSLRDYFAAKALEGQLAGMLADGSRLVASESHIHARAAYLLADAMLAARSRT